MHRVFHTPGAFGNYIGFLLGCKSKGKIEPDPFTQSGSSHDRQVNNSHDIVLTDGYTQFNTCNKNDFGIYWPTEYFFYILHSVYGRTNQGQYGACGVRALEKNTWQWFNSHQGHGLPGNDLSLFLKDLETLYNFKCDQQNQVVPKNLLRHYFFFHFVNFFDNKVFIKNNMIKNNKTLQKIHIETILDYDKLKQALGIDFDFKRTHEKFIDKNLSLKAYDIKNSIVEAVKQNKNIAIQNLDVLTEAGVLFELEKHFYDIPFFNLNFNFQSTKDIYNYITEYPNYMRRPNNLFLQNWRIYNVK